MKKENDIIKWLRQKDFVMVNPNLGAGSFGKTVLLKDPQLDDMLFVAKKYEPEKITDKKQFFKNFVDEIKILLKLSHRNIVRIYNWLLLEDSCTGFIVMEYIDGYDLRKYFKKYDPKYVLVSLDNIFVQLIEGFQYIEKNSIIHRDVKEENILITKDGIVKIIDFGIGKIIEKAEPVTHDTLSGKINRNMVDIHPEEEFLGVYTSQTDMFYLAELFTRLLHDSQKEQFFSYFPILEKMKKRNPQDRYNNFSEIQEAITRRDFSTLKITGEDKETYQKFAISLWEILSQFNSEPVFCCEPSKFLKSLDDVLNNNILEDTLQKNNDLLSCIIESGYNFKPKHAVSVDVVKIFRNWFCSLDAKTQNLVLKNIQYKLSRADVKHDPSDDIPF